VALRWIYDDERASEMKLQSLVLGALAAGPQLVPAAAAAASGPGATEQLDAPLTIEAAAKAARRAALAANMWCRIAAIGANRPSPYNELALKLAPPPPPEIASGFEAAPTVSLGAVSVWGRAVASDKFALPGGSLAERKARAEGKGRPPGSARGGGEGGDGGAAAAAVVVHRTAEEEEHDRKRLERKVKAAKRDAKKGRRAGAGGGSGAKKPPSEAPPPDPGRWLLQAEVFRLTAKDHLLPIMKCVRRRCARGLS